ncbi:MAG: RHS repeat domain-containing protein [Armatimonadota bacterium]
MRNRCLDLSPPVANEYAFVYDPTASIPAVLAEQPAAPGTIYYFREPNGALIARLDGPYAHYYHFDELGSTRLLTDSSGNVSDKYSYDAWGSILWREKYTDSIDQPYQYVGRFGYYTHYQEPDFGLMQLGVRFYDAETGRFTSRDPWTWSVNDERVLSDPEREEVIMSVATENPILYNLSIYCRDNPLIHTDASGKGYWKCKIKKPPWWCGPYGKPHWCQACHGQCQNYCNDNFNNKPGQTWKKCTAACTIAKVMCLAAQGYNFFAIWGDK